VLVKCWKVPHWNAKKLLKNCQKLENLLQSNLSIRTVSDVPTKFSYISSKENLYNTDPLQNGQRTLTLGPREQIHTNLTSLLQTLPGPGVDNLRYVPFPVGGYTNIGT